MEVAATHTRTLIAADNVAAGVELSSLLYFCPLLGYSVARDLNLARSSRNISVARPGLCCAVCPVLLSA